MKIRSVATLVGLVGLTTFVAACVPDTSKRAAGEGGANRLAAGEGGANRLAAGEGGANRLAAGEGGASRRTVTKARRHGVRTTEASASQADMLNTRELSRVQMMK